MITMSTKLRPSLFGVILLLLAIIVLINTLWQSIRVNRLQSEVEGMQIALQIRTSPPHANK